MGEFLPQFDREEKSVGGFSCPSFGDVRIGRTVKSAVDLYGVEKAAVIFKFAFSAWGGKSIRSRRLLPWDKTILKLRCGCGLHYSWRNLI